MIIKSNTAHIFHVGDTRIYLMRDGELELLTKDHQRSILPSKLISPEPLAWIQIWMWIINS
ncbi:serine/threonine protein kinase [Vibrio ishigakensis]|uniref:Serine/threonine protein kinase n=1 Tax=Vibrio ishigakensis TaxID=1481914 RepID=A0A0B8NYA7_9VIBR|nr:serine/threonine protein kinase [Vibrio ishigakensis]